MKKNIRSQIMFGYLIITLVPISLTLITMLCLCNINYQVITLNQNREHENATKDTIVGHYSWMMGLGDSLMDGREFTGSLDPTACGLGVWISGIEEKDARDPVIAQALVDLSTPHNEIHKSAALLIEQYKTDPQMAYAQYQSMIKPKVMDVINTITVITDRFGTLAATADSALKANILQVIIISPILVILGIIACYSIGRKISQRISVPIQTVARWSESLAYGNDSIRFTELDISQLDDNNEVSILVKSFERMAQSIQDNVSVVRRVAGGDLTAFVDIRSAQDNLGKNLYHMVQSNDLMFSDILQIASDVATSANQISQASQALSDSSVRQASSVDILTSTIGRVGDFASQNAVRVEEQMKSFQHVQDEAHDCSTQMDHLVFAVNEIKAASDKISTVIATIENIAFQTNILALNAAVEAARAGIAGKGFAVVADEVRNLANKSARAADETKALIGNTIAKSHDGSRIAVSSMAIFAKIIQIIEKTAAGAQEIAQASRSQENAIHEVHQSLSHLADIATSNAASCEQSAAASAEMHQNAGLLRQAMSRFNLRQRQMGKAYIPPEKQNDFEFIRQANENYNRSLAKGRETGQPVDF